MRYSHPHIVLKEVPDEISLAISVSGCHLRCKGCHSVQMRNPDYGKKINDYELQRLIHRNNGITCVVFYGGEWDMVVLQSLIHVVKCNNLKVALYSGFPLSFFSKDFINTLDYIKVNPYKQDLGGLDDPNTNQKMYAVQQDGLNHIKMYKE